MVQEAKLIQTISEYDIGTSNHCQNVAVLASMIGKHCKLTRKEQDLLYAAGLVHDIGKIFIPKEIILKNGPLTSDERKIVDQHSMFGYIYLSAKEIDPNICDLTLHHHQNHNLSASSIDFLNDIIVAADIYDAMISDRPYRKALSKEEAMEEILRHDVNEKVVNIIQKYF